MEFIAGIIVGVAVAGTIGRAKFLQVQNQIRNWRTLAQSNLDRLVVERNLVKGLTETLDDLAQRTRIKA